MNHMLGVHIHERAAYLAGKIDRAIARKRARVVQFVAHRDTLDILHRDVHAAFVPRSEIFNDVRMIEATDNLFLTLEAAVEDDVILELLVRNFDRYGLPTQSVDGFKDRSHSASRDEIGQPILIKRVADVDVA